MIRAEPAQVVWNSSGVYWPLHSATLPSGSRPHGAVHAVEFERRVYFTANFGSRLRVFMFLVQEHVSSQGQLCRVERVERHMQNQHMGTQAFCNSRPRTAAMTLRSSMRND